MAESFKDRFGGAALITGASSGLGEEFARQLAKKGMDIVIVARSKDKLEATAKKLQEEYKVKVHVISQDLTARDCAAKVKSECDAKGIKIGLLVNNAGYGSYGLFKDLDLENEIKMIELNTRTPLAMTGAFLPDMIKSKKGGLIFLSSIGSYQPTPYFANYSATKAWNLMFGEALYGELKSEGIDVIALSPGYTKTGFQDHAEVGNKPIGGWSTADYVVKKCLDKLGKTPSYIPGIMNFLLAWSIRFTPRSMAIMVAKMVGAPAK